MGPPQNSLSFPYQPHFHTCFQSHLQQRKIQMDNHPHSSLPARNEKQEFGRRKRKKKNQQAGLILMKKTTPATLGIKVFRMVSEFSSSNVVPLMTDERVCSADNILNTAANNGPRRLFSCYF
ncbi:hypothetical protein CEXT_169991 [Caerostris extrusa]|uniref:Uncharacterized protein n=1 Tax=Caerostris extrusa TaxID=172846 RepID=A0AAV4WMX3_CAEEX|nr:hypothetical protein CEXT_169991 [Caerostris extrusa]